MNTPTVYQGEEPRTLTHVMYALHTITWFSGGIFSVVAMLINLVKSGELPDDFYRSHWRWQARTFWFALLWFVVTAPLFALLFVPGAIAWFVIGLWYLYRCVRGWIAFSDRRPMPV